MENCSTVDWQTADSGGGEAGPSWMSGVKESTTDAITRWQSPGLFCFCFDRCQPPGIHMQVCSALIVALGGTDNVRIWKKKQKKRRRKSKAGGTRGRGGRRMSVWWLDSNKGAEACQWAKIANQRQDPREPVMINKLIKSVSGFGKKESGSWFKRLSASPVERFSGKNNTQLTQPCTYTGTINASHLLLNKRQYA